MGNGVSQIPAGGNGGSSDDFAYVMHYTGGRWIQAQASIRARITAIKMLSPTDGWAIGNRVYHYDGTSWREIHMPVNTQFNAISAVSPSNIWIVGVGSTPVIPSDGRAVILHYDGNGWFPQPTPSGFRIPSLFNDIAMVSATEGWAVGTAEGRCLIVREGCRANRCHSALQEWRVATGQYAAQLRHCAPSQWEQSPLAGLVVT